MIWCQIAITDPRDRTRMVYARSWWTANIDTARAGLARDLAREAETICDLAATQRGKVLPLDFVTILLSVE